ncbi:chemotaxis protein CheW [Hahella ganghwensis]|uniref:chemotaxis protein CheW n=1 Tax=Hahella ganghwensis TaxID=286420 RepID=UPI00037EA6BE|nr:chemotaxis protein CheW [Hahella ganghwensis]
MNEEGINEQWISFKVGMETYVHPILSIKEIIQYSEPVPVPGSPDEIEGILYVRGDVVTLLSGRTLLSEAHDEDRDDWRIIILETGVGQIGLTVDSVGDIVPLGEAEIEWNAQGSHSEVIKGTARYRDDLFILLNLSDYCRRVAVETADYVS